jgi:predicted AAA+ superfamily ATPase
MQLLLNQFNPWWQRRQVPEPLLGRTRHYLQTLYDSLSPRQMTFITGLRRVGKTTLIFQLVDRLIRERQVNPYHLLYFSFDESRFSLEEILAFYQTQILQDDLRAFERVYIFLDEIQKLSQWPEQVKILYDLHPNLKITLSGSANIIMKVKSRESLAGRFFDYVIDPLDFPEYLAFREIAIDSEREAVFQPVIVKEFRQFLKTGGFIEAMQFDDGQLVRYFKDSILERVTYRDIPEVFSIAAPDLLLRLLHIFAQQPGMYLEYKNLASDLQFDQRTIMNYLGYLEYSFLLQKLYNYSTNLLSSEKKLKRAYLSNTGFTHALAGELNFPLLMEQFWVNLLKAVFFYRSPQKDEVDLVHVSGGFCLPIEIKMRENVSAKDAGALFKFLRYFGRQQGLLISLHEETEWVNNGMAVKVLPYWKYWSIRKWIEEMKA